MFGACMRLSGVYGPETVALCCVDRRSQRTQKLEKRAEIDENKPQSGAALVYRG